MGTLTPAPLLPAPGQVSLIHDHALPVIPSPTTPCAPVFRQCFLLRAGLASDSLCVAIGGSSDFALLRQSHQSHQAVSSLCRNPWLGCSSTDYPFTSSCSPPRVATTQLLSVSGGKLRHRGTLTLLCTLTLKRTEASRWDAERGTLSRFVFSAFLREIIRPDHFGIAAIARVVLRRRLESSRAMFRITTMPSWGSCWASMLNAERWMISRMLG